jgi:hypothetical protein
VYYVHKYEVAEQYGGPEEGGWWYTQGRPTEDSPVAVTESEELAYELARQLNHEEQNRDKEYDYHSVLSYKEDHYTYTVEETREPKRYPVERPHYA